MLFLPPSLSLSVTHTLNLWARTSCRAPSCYMYLDFKIIYFSATQTVSNCSENLTSLLVTLNQNSLCTNQNHQKSGKKLTCTEHWWMSLILWSIMIVYMRLLCLFALVSRDTDGCLLAFWFPSHWGPRSRPCSEACVAFCTQGTRLVDLLVCWRAKTDKELKCKNKRSLSVSMLRLI